MLEKDGAKAQLKVSVCVITYNHKPYIAKCLESILSQKCNFDLEIVVRDDFSNDGTAEIVKYFKNKFPKKIKLLDGSINIGGAKNVVAVYAAAQGQYITACEGDDYWIDDAKLQKQVDLMDADSGITFTAHPCRVHDENGLKKKPSFVKASEIIVIDCNDVLRVAGQFAPTASYMYRRGLFATLPDWFEDVPVGDFFVEMYALAMGSGRYLPDPMSAYRTFSLNSWSSTNTGNNGAARLRNATKMLFYLNKMSKEDFFKKYDFSPKIGAVYFNISTAHLLIGDYDRFRQSIVRCKLEQTKFPLKHKFFYYTRGFPKLVNYMYQLKLRWHA